MDFLIRLMGTVESKQNLSRKLHRTALSMKNSLRIAIDKNGSFS